MPPQNARACCRILLLLALLLLPPAHASAQGPPAAQLRGMWVDATNPGFHTPAEVDELVENAAAANMNALFVQMRRHGDAWYNQRIEPRAALPELAVHAPGGRVQGGLVEHTGELGGMLVAGRSGVLVLGAA